MNNPNSLKSFLVGGLPASVPQQQIMHAAEVIEDKLSGFEDNAATIDALCDCGDIGKGWAVQAIGWLVDMHCVEFHDGKVWKLF
jgi:hypothetical protein